MIRTQRISEHIDPCTLNLFVDGELQVGEQERIRQHLKHCRMCALYVVSGKELKAAIARAGLRFPPYATDTTQANYVRKGNLVYIDRPQDFAPPLASFNQRSAKFFFSAMQKNIATETSLSFLVFHQHSDVAHLGCAGRPLPTSHPAI
jgi:hypothetical protein